MNNNYTNPIWTFRCVNGHEYKSRQGITNGYFEAFIAPRLPKPYRKKANDRCRKCGAKILSTSAIINGRAYGSMLASEFMPRTTHKKGYKEESRD